MKLIETEIIGGKQISYVRTNMLYLSYWEDIVQELSE